MEASFYILLSMKTASGPESFGRFSIGSNRAAAYEVFRQMKGSEQIKEKDVLYMELTETKNGLPVNLELISCTLKQMTENCAILAREIFKLNNLHET